MTTEELLLSLNKSKGPVPERLLGQVTLEDFILPVLLRKKLIEMEVERMKEDQLLEINRLQNDFELEKKTLLKSNQEALEKFSKQEKEKTTLQSQMETAQKAHHQKATALESANNELKANNDKLEAEVTTLKADLEFARSAPLAGPEPNSVQPATVLALRQEVQTLHISLQAAKANNTRLRTQIVAGKGNMNDILRAEDHYVNQMQQISSSIEDWVAKHVKSSKKMEKERGYHLPALEDNVVVQIISKIKLLGDHGRKSAARLIETFSDRFKEGISRIALVRHIIALYLFHEVLSRFAFGLELSESNLLMKLEDFIWESQGEVPVVAC
jgi:hypothetical protein